MPGYEVWEVAGEWRWVTVEDGTTYNLEQDGSWTVVPEDDPFELSPFSPPVTWEYPHSGYEGSLRDGFTIEGYELIAGVETAHLRYEDAPEDMWADIWVDANGIVMRIVTDVAIESGEANRIWLIWDVLELDPQDVGPLPPS